MLNKEDGMDENEERESETERAIYGERYDVEPIDHTFDTYCHIHGYESPGMDCSP